MSARLKNQIAIITGAADGIGRAIAERYLAEGAKVCIADINADLGQEAADRLNREGPGATFVHTDVADPEAVQAMVAETCRRLGNPSILVNNAALIEVGKDALSVSDDAWRRNFAVNLDGYWHCCRTVLPLMKEAGGGSIINIGSVHAFQIVPQYFPYAVTKHAIIGLTRNLAVEYGPFNIRVNALCPGMVETPNAFKAWEATGDPDAARAAIATIHPLRRNASMEEIAYPAVFLASHESSFMTGQSLIVDGGRSVVYHD
ncbi:SDR family oxidoreductase [Microbulbifer thermotolerans]|uniref:SDR family oxidoreductase n=1 Tax=Microbulbifer thermotolerans TaxID=252514 RepID=A0AB35I191_MICTH|nr:SDR family oxidoreductase [Microbulbifer thermotolerans]MCX2780475.1 SDR family oxidoreductase [Microbulbifer thermotolerans]MCX2784074.1 SDR family oxidoreductase [Microbulbifer thermotolerans]MCX2794843.1 SDR family oxidoreductase [Microbulbifer thermotolerans]MCX2802931.1 SDR family oxidoreductase [Microbulbifer thermotolerans]MCX2806011.1 SDR family oxidoreductase [Microbulbifer thermotolerans]